MPVLAEPEPREGLLGLMDVGDVCRFLGKSKPSVFQLVRKGELPAMRMGNAFRFTLNDVLDYCEASRVAGGCLMSTARPNKEKQLKEKNRKRPDNRDRQFTNGDGYLVRRTDGRMVRLHREIYAKYIGAIPEGWHVHHIDGDKANNSPANLMAVSAGEHLSLHARNATRDCLGRFTVKDEIKNTKKGR